MKDNRRLWFIMLLVQFACIIGAFATSGAVSIAFWVIFVLLLIVKYVVMFRRIARSSQAPSTSTDSESPKA